MDYALIFHIFIIAFFVNVCWEVCHSVLYTTCLNQPWTKNVPLLLAMSAKDGAFIVLFFLATVFVFGGHREILSNISQTTLFVFLGLAFAFIDETVSLRRGRWEYASAMPTIAGVGLTPLLEIAVTGIITFAIVFYL